jgi:hypothetical protein
MGFGVERSSFSPDKRYGVLAPDSDHYDWTKHQNKFSIHRSGRRRWTLSQLLD